MIELAKALIDHLFIHRIEWPLHRRKANIQLQSKFND